MEKVPVFRHISGRKADWKEGTDRDRMAPTCGISLLGTSAVRFSWLYRANATRSQSDDVAKMTSLG